MGITAFGAGFTDDLQTLMEKRMADQIRQREQARADAELTLRQQAQAQVTANQEEMRRQAQEGRDQNLLNNMLPNIKPGSSFEDLPDDTKALIQKYHPELISKMAGQNADDGAGVLADTSKPAVDQTGMAPAGTGVLANPPSLPSSDLGAPSAPKTVLKLARPDSTTYGGTDVQNQRLAVIAGNKDFANKVRANNPNDSRMADFADLVEKSTTPIDSTKYLEYTKPHDAKTPTHVAGTVDGKPVFAIEQTDGTFTVNGQPAPNFRPPQTAGERINITLAAQKAAYAPDENGNPNPMAKALAEYRLPMTGRQLSSPSSRPLVEAALAIDPNFDAKNYDIRKKTKEAYTTGPQGQQVVAFNTAIHHIDQLQEAAKALGNGDFTPTNAGYQMLQQMFGSDAPTNMQALRELVATEVAKANSGGTPQKEEIAAQRAVLATKNSPEQIAGYVSTIIPALDAKIKSLDTQYRQVMGDDNYKLIFPETQGIVDRYRKQPGQPGQSGKSKYQVSIH